MLAASAHIANAKPASPGDAATAPPSGASADGFNGALAALMSQLGPPAPTPPQTTLHRSSERAASASAASAGASSFTPSSAPDKAATGQASASSDAAGGDGPDKAAAAAPGDGGKDSVAGASQTPATATSGQGVPTTTPAAQGAAGATGGAAPPAATQAATLDPRLFAFVAKAGTAATTLGAAAAAATTGAPTDQGVAGQDATAADQAASSAAQASAGDPVADGTGVSAALLSLLPPDELTPPSGPAPPSGAAPAKSAKTVQIQAALSADTTRTLAAAATPAIVAAKTAIADTAETPSDAAFTLPHDDNRQSAQTAQTSTETPASVDQIAQQTSLAGAPAATINAPPAAAALVASHGAEITAQLAAQISSRANAPRSAFDFALEPQGLGRVDVTLKFDSQGQLSAVLSFDNPNAAAEAKNRSADLQQALQQAGFDVGQSGLSFTSNGGQGHGAAWQAPTQTSYVNAPVLADTVAEAISPMTAHGATGAGGLDITI